MSCADEAMEICMPIKHGKAYTLVYYENYLHIMANMYSPKSAYA